MTAMKVTRKGQESYTMRRGYDPDFDFEILYRSYDDGTQTVAFRNGRGQTHLTWSPEVELHAVVES